MSTIELDELVIRNIERQDLEDILNIDEELTGKVRRDYYKRKIETSLETGPTISICLVADYQGKVVGFIMGNLHAGEFGIPENIAFLNTVGVSLDYQKTGIGNILMEEFQTQLRAMGVTHLRTIVDWDDIRLVKFFSMIGFKPSATVNLEKKLSVAIRRW